MTATAQTETDTRTDATWSAAVFAHDEAVRIDAALNALLAAADGHPLSVYVLANGCTDATEQRVRDYARVEPCVRLVSLPRADKSNAWNHYVHREGPTAAVHIFTDGDVQVAPGSLPRLVQALDESPELNAVGGVPLNGRDRNGMVKRLGATGSLAGGLYALRGAFLDRVRARDLRIPVGYIGDDWMAASFAKQLATGFGGGARDRVTLCPQAGFYFRSLDPLRPQDWSTYVRRWYRYRLRWYQSLMLSEVLRTRGLDALPGHMDALTAQAARLQLQSRGRNLPMDLLVLHRLRRSASAQRRSTRP